MKKILLLVISMLGIGTGYAQTSKFVKGPKLTGAYHSDIYKVSESKDKYHITTSTLGAATIFGVLTFTYENLSVSTVDKETLQVIDEPTEVFDYNKILGKYDYCYSTHLWMMEDKFVSAWATIPKIEGYNVNKFLIQVVQRTKKSDKLDVIKIPVGDYMEEKDTFSTSYLVADEVNNRLYLAIVKRRGDDQYRTEILTVDLESSVVKPLMTINNTERGWGKEFAFRMFMGNDRVLLSVDNLTDRTFKKDPDEDDSDSRDSIYYYAFNVKKKSLETLIYSGMKKERKDFHTAFSGKHFVMMPGFRSGAKDFDLHIYNPATDVLQSQKVKFPSVESLDEGWKAKKKFKWAKGYWAMDAMRYDTAKKNVRFTLSRVDYYNPPNTKNSDEKDFFDRTNGVIYESNHVGVTILSDGKLELGDEMQTAALYRNKDFAYLGKTFYDKDGNGWFIYQEPAENYKEGVWNGGLISTDFTTAPTDKKRIKKYYTVVRKIPSRGSEETPSVVLMNKEAKMMPLVTTLIRTLDGNLLVLARNEDKRIIMKLTVN